MTIKWLVELHRPGQPALFLYGKTGDEMAENIIEADDHYGEVGTEERMDKCWTSNALQASTYSEERAKQAAEALDRCCGGVVVAVEHMFIEE